MHPVDVRYVPTAADNDIQEVTEYGRFRLIILSRLGMSRGDRVLEHWVTHLRSSSNPSLAVGGILESWEMARVCDAFRA